jgi:thiol-disulfide isomerase/thioredoxin
MLKFLVFVLALPLVQAQVPDLNPNAPKPGTPAPELSFTQLLQAPAGTKADWPSLRGKVVVLEFWATWCAPCVAEIPVVNALIAASDPAKVRFISVDDEDPAYVEPFLMKHPIAGWIGIDRSGKLFDRFGVNARPTTMVIDPQGRVVSTTVRPEQLKPDQLAALAEGKPVVLGGPADKELEGMYNAAMTQALAFHQPGALFEISLTRGDTKSDTHILMAGGRTDITNAPLPLLLGTATGMPESRISSTGTLPDVKYSLSLETPGADPRRLAQAIELAIASVAHVDIRHSTATEDVYVLTAKPKALAQQAQASGTGFALYNAQAQTLRCLNATSDQLAGALETALGRAVINDSGFAGKLNASLKIVMNDAASAREALAALGFVLAEGKRPVERVIITPLSAPAAK